MFFCGLQTIKIPIVETDFMQKHTNSIRGFEPFGFDDLMHYFRHPIDEFLSLFHGTRVPNLCQSVFPHDHCSSLVAVLFPPFHILLRQFKIFSKFSFTRLTIVTPCGITIFCAVLNYFKSGRRSKLKIYPRIFSCTWINLK